LTAVAYADASALVKLALDEAESGALRRWFVEAERVATSLLGIVETQRAVRRRAHDPEHLQAVVRSIDVIGFDPDVARLAGDLQPSPLKTLDAIHLATALRLLPDLDAFVTYDDRLADAARALGLPVVRPA
jgi:hypothetical protein